MAKGYAMERWQGKKGSNVFYKISNSSNAQKQGVRERVYEVSNPKTRSQALQRMKVRAAQNFYNTLAPILNRAMQGVKYGGMTRNEFMRYALSMNESPAVAKGSNIAIPGNYLLSKGSLPTFSLQLFNGTGQVHFDAPFVVTSSYSSNQTLSDNDVKDITSNGSLKKGDQITIVLNCNGHFLVKSFLINAGETIPKIDDHGMIYFDAGQLIIDDLININAAAVILSRKNGNKYERSTAYLALNEDSNFIKEAYSTQAINAALATYQKSVSVNSGSTDWPVEPEDDGQGSGVASISAPFVLSGLTGAKASLNGRKVLVYENVNTGDLTEVGTLSGYLVDFETHQTLLYLQNATYNALVPADVTALASLPKREINAGI